MQTKIIRALGAMSGTSLDGVDAAMLETDGVQIFDFGESDYRPYTAAEQNALRAALGRWPGPDLAAALAVVQGAHAELLGSFQADLIGFHGQTLAHEPRGRGTHQLGDGAALAAALDVPVVWDFRSADVAAGGEGAPLAPFFHFACAKWIGAPGPVAFLNLGGVGNITWIDPRRDAPEEEGALLAFDTGPANAPINDLMQARRGLGFDEDGALAAQGTADAAILAAALEGVYFARKPPKSLDRDAFRDVMTQVAGLSDADAAATLTQLCVASVAAGMQHCPALPARILVTGGGRMNPVIMDGLQTALGVPVQPVEAAGLDGDMLEAQAFAYLAVRVLHGLPTSAPGTTGVQAPVSGGQINPRKEWI